MQPQPPASGATNAATQITRIPQPRTSPGIEQAEQSADPWWRSCANAALEAEAATGRPFTAWTLVDSYGVTEPHHPGQWGALFRAAATAGLITKVDATQSERPGRAGGLCWRWRGVRR